MQDREAGTESQLRERGELGRLLASAGGYLVLDEAALQACRQYLPPAPWGLGRTLRRRRSGGYTRRAVWAWIWIPVALVANGLLFRWLGGFGGAGEAIERWGNHSARRWARRHGMKGF